MDGERIGRLAPADAAFFHVSGRWQRLEGDGIRLVLEHDTVGDVTNSGEGYPPYRLTGHLAVDSVDLVAAKGADGRWVYSCPRGTPVHLAFAFERKVSDTYINEGEFVRLVSVADSLERLGRGWPD